MKNSKFVKRSHLQFILIAFLAIMIGGCATIKLVADYDEKIDTGVTELHKQLEEFLVKLKSKTGTPEGSYEANKKFYDDVKVTISSLRVRADATQRNSLTVKMFDKLLNNINRLESDHKEGITKDEIPLYRGGFNSQFTAILTFELAKKRGQKTDEKAATVPATKVNKSN